MDQKNFIKNKAYFSFWDTWYFVIGNVGAFFKAFIRYLLGIASVLLLGYRVHISIMPHPFGEIDTLCAGFYATVVVECLKENIIPRSVSKLGSLNSPLIRDL